MKISKNGACVEENELFTQWGPEEAHSPRQRQLILTLVRKLGRFFRAGPVLSALIRLRPGLIFFFSNEPNGLMSFLNEPDRFSG